jgi:hypothetical protein
MYYSAALYAIYFEEIITLLCAVSEYGEMLTVYE